ncbi:MAG: hypothetical protein ACXVH1_09085, partial [Solirubrobacteraceae bacterium]
MTIEQELDPGGDFVPQAAVSYVAGWSPDYVTHPGLWSWHALTDVNGTETVIPPDVEAQSPTLNEQAGNDDFLSGIFFGLGAAALIAGIQ